MTSAAIYVSGGLAELLSDYLRSRKLHDAELARRLGAWSPQQRMPVETWWALLQAVQALDPRPGLGLHIGACARPRHVGVLGYLAMSCRTLGEALARFQRFQPLLHNLTPSLARLEDDGFHFSWDSSYGRAPLLSNEVLVSALFTVARQLTGREDIRPLKVDFPDADPGCGPVHAQQLGCPVRFGCRMLTVVLQPEVLAWPIDSGDPHLMALLDQQAEALLQASPGPDTLLRELQQALADALQMGEPTIEAVARQLKLAPRTLQRHLRERGSSFQGILADTRHRLARQYLADRRLSLPEIALLLGYSEQSAFTRAFKAWSGMTPLQARREAEA